MVIVLIAAGVAVGAPFHWLSLWVIALMLVATPVHALIEMPEHYGCERDSRDTLHNTRSMPSNRVMQWFTNGNNFHVEHHRYPNIPLQNARLVYHVLTPGHRYNEPGYRAFYRKLMAEIVVAFHRPTLKDSDPQ